MPSAKIYQKMWMEALNHGIGRDYPGKMKAFAKAKIEFVYYGDISGRFLKDIYRIVAQQIQISFF